MKVMVVGELNVDLILNQLTALPELGKEIICKDVKLTMGSSSAIFACNLSEMGTDVYFKGLLGKDQFGQLVMDSLHQHRVYTSFIDRSEAYETGISVATCYNGDRTMVTMPGCMELLTTAHISDADLKEVDHLHVSSIFLQPALKADIVSLFQRAKKLGLTTSMDPQYDPGETWQLDLPQLLPLMDVFLPNHSEILGLSHASNFDEAIANIRPMLSGLLVVKDGSNGSFLITKNDIVHQKAFLNEAVVDVIGAGDSFDAGFIHSFIQQKPLDDCLRFANAMGAINTTSHGGTSAFDGGMEAINKKLIQLIPSNQ